MFGVQMFFNHMIMMMIPLGEEYIDRQTAGRGFGGGSPKNFFYDHTHHSGYKYGKTPFNYQKGIRKDMKMWRSRRLLLGPE